MPPQLPLSSTMDSRIITPPTITPRIITPRIPTGRTTNGYVFDLPATTDMFHTLLSPRRWGPAECLTILLSVAQLLMIPLISVIPRPYFILVFAFWRLSYNLGLARLLYFQSKRNSVTNWVQSLSPSARSLLHWASTKSMDDDYAWEKLPTPYNSWIAFRAFAMVILTNDGVSYFTLAVACFNPFKNSPVWQLAIALPLGIALFALSVWAKSAAHDVLGDFAWYWGDFFFTVDADLKFDGVFELFPHPMYTIGYAGYYGAALICRSYTLLAISLVAHIAQLLFLAFVEEPHIQKLYGPKSTANTTVTKPKSIQPDPSPAPPSTPYHDFMHCAPRLPVIFALALAFSTVTVLAISARPSTSTAVFLLLTWFLAHWTLLTLSLPKLTTTKGNRWMRWFTSRRYSTLQAFSSWQHIYLCSFLMKHTLFLIVASTFKSSKPPHNISLAENVSDLLMGISLLAIAFVSLASTWSNLGYFGFFYGDFFVMPPARELQRSGMFRYVTNPEAVLGYLSYYGVAFIRQSRGLFLLAALCQSLHIMFIKLIESKHIEEAYDTAPDSTALEKATSQLPVVAALAKIAQKCLSVLVHFMDTEGKIKAKRTVRLLNVHKERLKADLNKSFAIARDKHVKPRTEELRCRAKSVVGELNCDSIVSMLGNRGIVVEPVSQSFLDRKVI